MKKIYAVATESDVVLAFESRSDADEYAGERCGKEVPATLAGYAKMVLRNSARIDGKARALCPECAESLRAWFLAGAVKPEGRE